MPCPGTLPGCLARYRARCRARVPCPGALPGFLARVPCPGAVPGCLARCRARVPCPMPCPMLCSGALLGCRARCHARCRARYYIRGILLTTPRHCTPRHCTPGSVPCTPVLYPGLHSVPCSVYPDTVPWPCTPTILCPRCCSPGVVPPVRYPMPCLVPCLVLRGILLTTPRHCTPETVPRAVPCEPVLCPRCSAVYLGRIPCGEDRATGEGSKCRTPRHLDPSIGSGYEYRVQSTIQRLQCRITHQGDLPYRDTVQC